MVSASACACEQFILNQNVQSQIANDIDQSFHCFRLESAPTYELTRAAADQLQRTSWGNFDSLRSSSLRQASSRIANPIAIIEYKIGRVCWVRVAVCSRVSSAVRVQRVRPRAVAESREEERTIARR